MSKVNNKKLVKTGIFDIFASLLGLMKELGSLISLCIQSLGITHHVACGTFDNNERDDAEKVTS